MELNK